MGRWILVHGDHKVGEVAALLRLQLLGLAIVDEADAAALHHQDVAGVAVGLEQAL